MEVRVGGGGAVDLGVPGARRVLDVLERGDRDVAVVAWVPSRIAQHPPRVVVVLLEDRVDGRQVDRVEAR